MTLALVLLLAASLAELVLYAPGLWPAHRATGAWLSLALAWLAAWLLVLSPSWWTLALGVVSGFRIFSLLRLVERRLPVKQLRAVAFLSSWQLIGVQGVLAAFWYVFSHWHVPAHIWWWLLTVLDAAIAAGLLAMTLQRLRRMRPGQFKMHYADSQLPSISVCIPARNETEALNECLQALVASDYPKLEILVLDDHSQEKTSDVVRSFAHAGVRYVKGEAPDGNWLAKNWAYEQLYQTSNGELLVFCGVDIQQGVASLRQLVTIMLERNKEMLTLVPRNDVPRGRQWPGLLLQPFRYGWEICLPRRALRRPPALSSCWVARRDFIRHTGGFAAVSRSIAPESYLARRAAADDGYSFITSSRQLAVTSHKDWQQQWQTALRTRYPQLHRRPELTLAVLTIELFCLLAPLAMSIVWLCFAAWGLAVVNIAAGLLLLALYARLAQLTYQQFLWRGLVLLPLALLVNMAARLLSMRRYEFGDIYWKGRNVARPVLHSDSTV